MKKKTLGRPVDAQFEQEVWDECIFWHVNDKKESVILANCAYSYEVIRKCAERVQDRVYKVEGVHVRKWRACPRTKDLKFSNKWIWRALRRKMLVRRRVTTTIKAEPSEQKINEHMRQEIHSIVEEHSLEARHIFNADETGIRWAECIKYQYVAKSAERAVAPPGDETGRFTAHLGSSADGDMLPLYLIVKVSCKDSTDLSKSRVLKNFLSEDGPCKPSEGWKEGLFTKEHPHPARGTFCIHDTTVYYVLYYYVYMCIYYIEGTKVVFKRPYLINTVNLNVVTVQNKAWNDSSGMRMHIELQLKPYRARMFPDSPHRKLLLILDNCPSHSTEEVLSDFGAAGWTLRFLPPNMTGKMQPMDLVVNSVCKAALRKLRIELTVDYFADWKAKRLAATYAGAPLPPFSPPKPAIVHGVQEMFRLMSTRFMEDNFKASLRKTFVAVSLTKDTLTGSFRPYAEKFMGCIKVEEDSSSKIDQDSRPLHLYGPNFSLAGDLLDCPTRSVGVLEVDSDDEDELVSFRERSKDLDNPDNWGQSDDDDEEEEEEVEDEGSSVDHDTAEEAREEEDWYNDQQNMDFYVETLPPQSPPRPSPPPPLSEIVMTTSLSINSPISTLTPATAANPAAVVGDSAAISSPAAKKLAFCNNLLEDVVYDYVGRSGPLELRLSESAFDDKQMAAALVSSSLTSYPDFVRFLQTTQSCLQVKLTHGVSNAFSSVKSDGFCWFSVWTHLWLMCKKGIGPTRKLDMCREDDKAIYKSALNDLKALYTEEQLLTEVVCRGEGGPDRLLSLRMRLHLVGEYIDDSDSSGSFLPGYLWGGNHMDFGTVPASACLAYWEYTANGALLSKVSVPGNLHESVAFNLVQLDYLFSCTHSLHCVYKANHFYLAGGGGVLFGNILLQNLVECVQLLYSKLRKAHHDD